MLRPTLGSEEFNPDLAAAKELAKLVEKVLSDPNERASFYKDPRGTAVKAGVKVEIDEKFEAMFNTLAALSLQELTLLASLNDTWPLYIGVDVPEESLHPLMVF
jgi:hypothetical protein